jgi:hypothetical protein
LHILQNFRGNQKKLPFLPFLLFWVIFSAFYQAWRFFSLLPLVYPQLTLKGNELDYSLFMTLPALP